MNLSLICPQAGERHEFLSGSVRHSTHRPHTQTPELSHHRGAGPRPPHADQEPDQPLYLTGRCHTLLLSVSSRGYDPCGRARSVVPHLSLFSALPPSTHGRSVTSSESSHLSGSSFPSPSTVMLTLTAHPLKKTKMEGPRMVHHSLVYLWNMQVPSSSFR